MSRVIQVRQLLEDTIKELNEQLREIGFTDSDIEEFKEQPIDAVEETLQSTTFYVFRNDDNKAVTIKDNRSQIPTEYLVVDYINKGKELYEEVIDIHENDDTDELIIAMSWDGTQKVTEFIDLESVKSYYYIDNPNHV